MTTNTFVRSAADGSFGPSDRRSADGAGADRERVGNRRVVEVGVVVQEDDLALSLGQQIEREHRCVPVRRGGGRHRGRVPAAGIAGGVDDDPPDPGLEGAVAAVAAALAHRGRERLLHRVAAELPVAGDRRRDAAELRQPGSVQLLELVGHLRVRRAGDPSFFTQRPPAPRLRRPGRA